MSDNDTPFEKPTPSSHASELAVACFMDQQAEHFQSEHVRISGLESHARSERRNWLAEMAMTSYNTALQKPDAFAEYIKDHNIQRHGLTQTKVVRLKTFKVWSGAPVVRAVHVATTWPFGISFHADQMRCYRPADLIIPA
jgi:hypothetical protein